MPSSARLVAGGSHLTEQNMEDDLGVCFLKRLFIHLLCHSEGYLVLSIPEALEFCGAKQMVSWLFSLSV